MGKTLAKKLRVTPAMLLMLRDTLEHKDPFFSLHGMSARGGGDGTKRALVRRGLLTWQNTLTDAGRTLAVIGDEVVS